MVEKLSKYQLGVLIVRFRRPKRPSRFIDRILAFFLLYCLIISYRGDLEQHTPSLYYCYYYDYRYYSLPGDRGRALCLIFISAFPPHLTRPPFCCPPYSPNPFEESSVSALWMLRLLYCISVGADY